jgi:hypothetical protein
MKKLLLIGALLCVLCACGSGNTKKHSTSMACSHNGHEWVDLGLPSGLKWATCNVGASTPEEYGDYFAWGEIRTKSEFLESNCVSLGQSWGDIGGNSSRDAARANWGGNWRLPTESELKELMNNCTWAWITQNGNSGYIGTGPNGESIFFPMPGIRDGYTLLYEGEYGYYWSSSPYEMWLVPEGGRAYCFRLFEGHVGVGGVSRHYGVSIRPVLGD